MRTITLEEHFVTPEFLKAVTRHAGATPYFMKLMQEKLLDLGPGRIADMDAAGIDMQVLSLAASGLDQLEPATATALARDTNDTLAAAVRAHPTRFGAFATVALLEPEKEAAELERCIGKLGFQGVMVFGTIRGRFLDHAGFTPLLEAVQALDVPLYLHPAPPPQRVMEAYYGDLPGEVGFLLSTAGWGWHVETGMHCLRLIVSGVFDRFPRLKIIIGHMGENLPFSLARADTVLGHAATHLERRVAEYFHEHFYVTTSGYFTVPPFLCAFEVVGADRLLFSVDYPFSPNIVGRNFLDALPVSPEDREKISHRNAERLLRL
jgi:uncharacterized protein